MSLTAIRKRLEEETKEKVKSMHAEAEKERDSIISDAEQRAKEMTKRGDLETDEELKRLEMEQFASTELAAREIELVAREEALDGEINATRKELIKALEEDETLYKKLFSNALKEASEIGPLRDFTILTSKQDAKYVSKSDGHVEYKDVGGGLIIQSTNKDVQIDATLDEIVNSKNDDIKSALLVAMFGEKERSAPQKKASLRPRKGRRQGNTQRQRQRKSEYCGIRNIWIFKHKGQGDGVKAT